MRPLDAMSLVRQWLGVPRRPELRSGRVALAVPRPAHYEAWSLLRETSRQSLVPFEPEWQPDELSRPAWRRRLARYRSERDRGTGEAFLILRASDRALVGGITLSNLRRGVTQTASVGYWIGVPYLRQGFASEAVALLLGYAFEDLGLNRIEAACMPSNAASIAVLERAGFRHEGVARGYLRINGVFEDHLLYARLCGDAPHRVFSQAGYRATAAGMAGNEDARRPAVDARAGEIEAGSARETSEGRAA